MRNRPCIVIAAILMVIAGSVYPSASARAEAGVQLCPSEHSTTREAATIFLADSGYAADRAALGLTPADTARLVLLRDATAAAACTELNAAMAQGDMGDYPNVHAYYRVGDYYLIAIGIHPNAQADADSGAMTIYIGRSAVAVLDTAYALLTFVPI